MISNKEDLHPSAKTLLIFQFTRRLRNYSHLRLQVTLDRVSNTERLLSNISHRKPRGTHRTSKHPDRCLSKLSLSRGTLSKLSLSNRRKVYPSKALLINVSLCKALLTKALNTKVPHLKVFYREVILIKVSHHKALLIRVPLVNILLIRVPLIKVPHTQIFHRKVSLSKRPQCKDHLLAVPRLPPKMTETWVVEATQTVSSAHQNVSTLKANQTSPYRPGLRRL